MFDPILDRLQREIEVVVCLKDISRKSADRSTRLGLREVSAFEHGCENGYEYMHGVLVQLMVDIAELRDTVQPVSSEVSADV